MMRWSDHDLYVSSVHELGWINDLQNAFMILYKTVKTEA